MAASSGAIRAGRAYVELFADDSKLAAGLKRGLRRMRAFGQQVRAVGGSMVAGGLAMAAPLAVATKIFAGFSDQMQAVKAITGATESQFETLKSRAMELGRTTSFTAGEVAGLMTSLSRAGFSPEQIDQATGAVLALGRATGTELSEAADIAANAMRAFGLSADEMPRVADVLTGTVNNSTQTLDDLAESLKNTAPIARQMGVSIEDTAAALGVLANNAIKGSVAGNAMKRAWLNLANADIQKKLKKLTGIDALDAEKNVRPLADIITEIGKATASMGSGARLDAFSTIFGDRAVVAASTLATAEANFTSLSATLHNVNGIAQRTAETMDAGIGGSFRRVASAAEGMAISIGQALAPELEELSKNLITIAGDVTAFVTENREAVVAVAEMAAGLIAVGGTLVVFGTGVSVATTAVKGLQVAMMLLSRNPWIAAATLAVGAVIAIGTAADDSSSSVGRLTWRISGMTDRLWEAIDAMRAVLGLGPDNVGAKGAKRADETIVHTTERIVRDAAAEAGPPEAAAGGATAESAVAQMNAEWEFAQRQTDDSPTNTLTAEQQAAIDSVLAETGQGPNPRLEKAGDDVNRMSQRASSSVGTYSARAGAQLGAASSAMMRLVASAERSAKAAEDTAENTAEMNDTLENLDGVEAE